MLVARSPRSPGLPYPALPVYPIQPDGSIVKPTTLGNRLTFDLRSVGKWLQNLTAPTYPGGGSLNGLGDADTSTLFNLPFSTIPGENYVTDEATLAAGISTYTSNPLNQLSAWASQNQTAVYLGCGVLVLLALSGGRR